MRISKILGKSMTSTKKVWLKYDFSMTSQKVWLSMTWYDQYDLLGTLSNSERQVKKYLAIKKGFSRWI